VEDETLKQQDTKSELLEIGITRINRARRQMEEKRKED